MPTVRVVLANAAELDWEIEHVDVKSAYLNAPLEETIYMKPPRGVLKAGQEGKVLRLLKGLYGLKHQQKCMILVCGYIAIHGDNINAILEIQAFKYMRIHRTSKM